MKTIIANGWSETHMSNDYNIDFSYKGLVFRAVFQTDEDGKFECKKVAQWYVGYEPMTYSERTDLLSQAESEAIDFEDMRTFDKGVKTSPKSILKELNKKYLRDTVEEMDDVLRDEENECINYEPDEMKRYGLSYNDFI